MEEVDPRAEGLIKRQEALKAQRGPWDSFWQNLGDYIQPRKANITTKTNTGPDNSKVGLIYDSTACSANMTLAQGQMSLVSPVDEVWFEFSPPKELEEDEDAIVYYRTVADIVRRELAESNFYSQLHEFYLQRSGFGTATLFSDWRKNKLFFKAHDIGGYSICEDHDGVVDTFVREFVLSARQAASMFGMENLPEKIRMQAMDPKQCDNSFDFIHFVMPRDEVKPGAPASQRMPFQSVFISLEGKQIVKDSGFEEMPYHVSRYLDWSDSTIDPYGWCPGWNALPDIRQINLLQMYMDVLAENAAFPRVIAPATLEGEIDMRALGITYYDPISDRAKPEEWGSQGRYDVGADRVEHRRRMINEAYHVDLFKMFGTLDKQAQMSVREVVERSSEKLLQFSPTFFRLVNEFFNPMLLRVSNVLSRNDKFNAVEVPDSVRQASKTKGEAATPQIIYLSRIALALQTLQNAAAIQTMEAVMPVAQVDPSILDTFDWDSLIRGYARNTGLPEKWLRTLEEVAEIQAQRQALAEAAQEAEINEREAKAVQAAQPTQ